MSVAWHYKQTKTFCVPNLQTKRKKEKKNMYLFRSYPLRVGRGQKRQSSAARRLLVSSCDTVFTAHAHEVLPFSQCSGVNPQSLAPGSFLRRLKDCKMVCNLSQYANRCIHKSYVVCCVLSDVSKHAPDVQMKFDWFMLMLTGPSLAWPGGYSYPVAVVFCIGSFTRYWFVVL